MVCVVARIVNNKKKIIDCMNHQEIDKNIVMNIKCDKNR